MSRLFISCFKPLSNLLRCFLKLVKKNKWRISKLSLNSEMSVINWMWGQCKAWPFNVHLVSVCLFVWVCLSAVMQYLMFYDEGALAPMNKFAANVSCTFVYFHKTFKLLCSKWSVFASILIGRYLCKTNVMIISTDLSSLSELWRICWFIWSHVGTVSCPCDEYCSFCWGNVL